MDKIQVESINKEQNVTLGNQNSITLKKKKSNIH